MSRSYNPVIAETTTVWANPISLRRYYRNHFCFLSSSGYLDVSVHRVYFSYEITCLQHAGLPHSDIYGSQFVCADPRSFSQLITSFIASESLGIPHTPFSSLSLDLNSIIFVLFTYKIRVLYSKYIFPKKNIPCPNMSMNVLQLTIIS